MGNMFLYEEIDGAKKFGQKINLPEIITSGLSSNIILRAYQIEAFKNFLLYFESDSKEKNKQVHTLFHMATGSGKTVIMAGLILYLYTKGYRKFLFFVNQTNVLEKTIENFTNPSSNKYLFNDIIKHLGDTIKIQKVDNFSNDTKNIEIVFTTTQKLHMDLFEAKENSLTYDDFENNEVVFISDESHHINSMTKKKTKDEEIASRSWEYSVMNAFKRNKNSIMLEFTATCDLKDANVSSKYKDKIIFNYPLKEFRESGYTKDFQNFATDTDLWTRTLIALVMSEYRRFLFADLKLNIKPVVMLKSQKINESNGFYDEFFKRVKELTSYELQNLELVGIEKLTEAIQYFKDKDKDATLELLEHAIKNSFTEDTSIIMNGSSDNNKENQLLVNSLEDTNNPIRLIFAVDMLNEGWDVLNLFDIVRLYDTRQSSNYTIKEAQLIGRGARYCPFEVEGRFDKFKRKYDYDINNKNRILETMYFHSKNDSKYISELKQALIETGLQAQNPIVLEYKLKDTFKESSFYKEGLVYSNKRILKSRKQVKSIEEHIRHKTYYYTVPSGKGNIISLFGEDEGNYKSIETNVTALKFKDIGKSNLNILLGTAEYFEQLRFNVLKEKYPSLTSKKAFLISEQYLGNIRIEITHTQNNLSGRDLFLAVKKVLSEIALHIASLKPEYKGSETFSAKKLNEVLKDKTIYLEKKDGNGGKGNSQNNCENEEYRLDLKNRDWYVFNDNFGTSEEKLFIRYFNSSIKPKLDEKNLEYYVIRNERIPEFAIYSFDSGERFEPDFLLFVRKKKEENPVIKENNLVYQSYIEPKGEHLIKQDQWKEDFSLNIKDTCEIEQTINEKKLFGEYKIIGFPFYNDSKKEEFENKIKAWIDSCLA